MRSRPEAEQLATHIITAISFLTKGDADAWAQNYVQAHNAAIDLGTIAYDDFLVELDKKFLDPQVAERARSDLFRSSQRDLKADVFFLRFDDLRVKAGLNSDVHDLLLVDHLKRHMNPLLVANVLSAFDSSRAALQAMTRMLLRRKKLADADYHAEMKTLEQPISYDEFRQLAIEHDPVVRRYTRQTPTVTRAPHVERRSTVPVLYQQYTPSPAPVVAQFATAGPPARVREPDVIPMDVDRARARANRLCYRCQKPGHLARDCCERDLKEVVRQVVMGMTKEDFDEILKTREGTSAAAQYAGPTVVERDDEKDFSAPQ